MTLVRNASDVDQVATSFDDYTLDGTVVYRTTPSRRTVGSCGSNSSEGGITTRSASTPAASLCPSDACQVGARSARLMGAPSSRSSRTMRLPMWTGALRSSPIRHGGRGDGGVTGTEGRLHFYDVNINTNYNGEPTWQ